MPTEATHGSAQTLLETRGLTKEFRGFRAVSDVDLAVARGEMLAIVGPSGCVKSPLLRIVAGHRPASGKWSKCGVKPVAARTAARRSAVTRGSMSERAPQRSQTMSSTALAAGR